MSGQEGLCPVCGRPKADSYETLVGSAKHCAAAGFDGVSRGTAELDCKAAAYERLKAQGNAQFFAGRDAAADVCDEDARELRKPSLIISTNTWLHLQDTAARIRALQPPAAEPASAIPLSRAQYLVRNAELAEQGSDVALRQRKLCAKAIREPSVEWKVEDQALGSFTRTPRPLVYLACPYSHADRAVRLVRFEAVNRAAAVLMHAGDKVFSPISHTHPIAEAGDLPKDWAYWEEFDRAYLGASYKLVVLKLAGWDTSKGVQAEIGIAQEMGIPVEYMEPTTQMCGECGRMLSEHRSLDGTVTVHCTCGVHRVVTRAAAGLPKP